MDKLLETILSNAMQPPKVYYGLHFTPGVAEYSDPETGEAYRIFINESTAKSMDKSMAGVPLYVNHVAEVDISKIQAEAAGYVFESFYNPLDGNHWCKFIVVSDAGHTAIKRGYTLSNTYKPMKLAPGGTRHNVEYLREITEAEYRHLALVDDPRYEHSMVLTPEEFKDYNLSREQELKAVANAKDEGEPSMKLNFFKRTKIDNSKELDIENTIVELPKSKKEMSISEIVNSLDEIENSKGKAKPALEIDTVAISDKETMTVGDLKKELLELRNAMDEDDKDNKSEEDEKDNESDEDKKKREEEEEKANAIADEAKKKADAEKENARVARFKKINNAHKQPLEEKRAEDGQDRVARGKQMFGSESK